MYICAILNWYTCWTKRRTRRPLVDDSGVFISDGGSRLREGGKLSTRRGMRVTTSRCYGYCRQSNGRHPLRLSNRSCSEVFFFFFFLTSNRFRSPFGAHRNGTRRREESLKLCTRFSSTVSAHVSVENTVFYVTSFFGCTCYTQSRS